MRHLTAALDGVAVSAVAARTAEVLFRDADVPAFEPRALCRLLAAPAPPPLSADADRRGEEIAAGRAGRKLDGTPAADQDHAARERLRALLTGDEAARVALLAALRRKLAEYRYRTPAVLFELFQNAADAAVELGGPAVPGFAVRVPSRLRGREGGTYVTRQVGEADAGM